MEERNLSGRGGSQEKEMADFRFPIPLVFFFFYFFSFLILLFIFQVDSLSSSRQSGNNL